MVVVARRGLQHGNTLSDSVGHDLGIISDHPVCLYTLGSIHRRGNRVVLHFNDDFGGIRSRIQRATVCLYIIIQQIAGTCDGVVTDANIRCAVSLQSNSVDRKCITSIKSQIIVFDFDFSHTAYLHARIARCHRNRIVADRCLCSILINIYATFITGNRVAADVDIQRLGSASLYMNSSSATGTSTIQCAVSHSILTAHIVVVINSKPLDSAIIHPEIKRFKIRLCRPQSVGRTSRDGQILKADRGGHLLAPPLVRQSDIGVNSQRRTTIRILTDELKVDKVQRLVISIIMRCLSAHGQQIRAACLIIGHIPGNLIRDGRVSLTVHICEH